jgi:hypothetical protein
MKTQRVVGLIILVCFILGMTFSQSYTQHVPAASGQGFAIVGTHDSGALGVHLSGVGDLNGDGIGDLIIGEPGYENDKGKAHIFFGRSDPQWAAMSLAQADASFVGENLYDWFGRWTSGLGDVNGDGFDDFAVSAMWNDDGATMAGKTYLFFGGPDVEWAKGTPANSANVTLLGEGSYDGTGHGVYGIGDVNGDFFNDILISGMGNDEGGDEAGQVYLFFGRSTEDWEDNYSLSEANASWIGTSAGDELSIDAAGVGDVNNDNFADFAIGSIVDDGTKEYRKVYVILGSSEPDWTTNQPISMANASFVGSNNTGLHEVEMEADWISGGGDVNGDDYDDIIIGAYEDDDGGTNAGQVYLFLGRSTERWKHDIPFSEANASFIGESSNDWAGISVSCVGDVNSDMFDDMVIGATTPTTTSSSEGRGHSYLIFGGIETKWGLGTSLSDANASYISDVVGDGFGWHVCGVGDVNNDSAVDFAIGAPHYDGSMSKYGKVFIKLRPLEPQTTTTSTTATSTTTTTTTTTEPPPPPPEDIIPLMIIGIGTGLAVVVIAIVILRRR